VHNWCGCDRAPGRRTATPVEHPPRAHARQPRRTNQAKPTGAREVRSAASASEEQSGPRSRPRAITPALSASGRDRRGGHTAGSIRALVTAGPDWPPARLIPAERTSVHHHHTAPPAAVAACQGYPRSRSLGPLDASAHHVANMILGGRRSSHWSRFRAPAGCVPNCRAQTPVCSR
jgi:hypothetical protein